RAAARGDSVATHLVQWHRRAGGSRRRPVRPRGREPGPSLLAPVHDVSGGRGRQPAGRGGVPRAPSFAARRGPVDGGIFLMEWNRRVTALVAGFVFLAAGVVYFATLAPTVPFWDSGEFIAVSYILGIPHPPGTPFYVLLGRLATLIPFATVAQRVNAVSAVASAFTVMLTYLCGLKIIRLAQGAGRERADDWIAHVGAATGALMFAFSDSFWENSIEAEVYALMSTAQILVLWLGLRWWEEHERR